MSKCWKKGALHVHTLWSDGRSLPEMALKSYQNAEFDFVCLSDHNVFQDDPNVWLSVRREEGKWPPDLSADEYLRTKEMLGDILCEKIVSFKIFVRLKMFEELRREWEVPGKFLVIPGEEITLSNEKFGEDQGRLYQMHINVFNSSRYYPLPTGGGSAQQLIDRILEDYHRTEQNESFLMMNHPFYKTWDIDPMLLVNNPEFKVFEINNSGSSTMPEGWIYDREQYWDFILAHRLVNGSGLIYGTSSDDAHFYDPERIDTVCGCARNFVVVNCPEEFSAAAIRNSILKGDFYASSGVMLDDVNFDPASKQLKIRIHAEENTAYRTDFIVTKCDFDRTVKYKEFPHEQESLSRFRPEIPQKIGEIVKSVSGTEAEYTMADDDLYVRAIVYSDKDTTFRMPFYPEKQCAWIQPVTADSVNYN